MNNDLKQLVNDSWKLRNIDESELLKLLGIYSLREKNPDEILSMFRLMVSPSISDSESLEPIEEDIFFPTGETLSPKGVVDALDTLLEYGKELWAKYYPELHSILCETDGTCKYKFEIVNDFNDLIILITSYFSIGYGVAACLLLLLYQKGYPEFCR